MKILVISDSHGSVDNLNKAVGKYDWDYLFYLGDGINDLGTLKNLENVFYVCGNNDFWSNADIDKIIEVGNKRFLLTHGHYYSVKSGLGGLIKYAKELKVDFALFGHTHKHLYEVIDGITFLNPGAITKSFSKKSTYVELILENEKSYFNLIEI